MLFAKSDKEPLEEHIEGCLQVLASIREASPFLPEICKVSSLWEDVFWTLFFHDLGKAAKGFQDEIQGGDRWNYRHEILSAGLALNLNLPQERLIGIALAILTHHHGTQYLWSNYRTVVGAGRKRWAEKVEELKIYSNELVKMRDPFKSWANTYLGKELNFSEEILLPENCRNVLEQCLRPWLNEEYTLMPQKYYIFLRGLTVASDHLASAGPRAIRPGIKETHKKLLAAGKIKELHPFQEKLASLQGSALLAAPTGSGKTAAALLWSQVNQDSGRRIFYVLPYTASINAMQRELQDIFKEEDVGVLHHKALYFAYKDFLERDYGPDQATKEAKELLGLARKFYKPIKILTPFQILKAFYGVKGFEALLVEMAGGLFVFDEIHTYEPHVVALIVRAVEELRKLGAHFLFMSATLPQFLRDLLSSIMPQMPFITIDPKQIIEYSILEEARHSIKLLNGEILSHLNKIKNCLSQGQRVLTVCNTVEQAQEVYQALSSEAKNPKLLHGRFTLLDREHIEEELPKADLLVGTQAIEVSLNFSFDILFSEPAPIDALLQRMGRVNRFFEQKKPASVYIFSQGSKADEYIYYEDRVQWTLDLLSKCQGRPLTNSQAAELVEGVYKDGYIPEEQKEYKAAYDSFNYIIERLPLFNESEFAEEFFELIKAVEVVPIRFRDSYLSLRKEKKHLDAVAYILPLSLPQFWALHQEGRLDKVGNDLFVNAKYDPELGLLVKEREDIAKVAIL